MPGSNVPKTLKKKIILITTANEKTNLSKAVKPKADN